jgi:probable rRNA maturation factor
MSDYEIDITCDDGCEPYAGWQPQKTADLADFLLQELKMAAGCDLSIAFINEEHIAQLHVQWLDEPGATDVMSFPMDELRAGDAKPGSLGDVAICGTVAAKQALEAGHPVSDEVELLLTHGVLHLLGHDHAEPEEHQLMFGLQASLLQKWREREGA